MCVTFYTKALKEKIILYASINQLDLGHNNGGLNIYFINTQNHPIILRPTSAMVSFL